MARPRAPFQYGRQPGSIEHLFKMGGSYDFDIGLQLGFGYRWNSGTIASKTFSSSGRNLPYRVPVAYEYDGVSQRWLAPDAVGSLTNPSWGTVDLRVQYVFNVQRAKFEAFVDVFNVTNNQDPTRRRTSSRARAASRIRIRFGSWIRAASSLVSASASSLRAGFRVGF